MGGAESVGFETTVDVLAAFAFAIVTFVPLDSRDGRNAGKWFAETVDTMRQGGNGAFDLDPGWFYWIRLVPYAALAVGMILYWTRDGSANRNLFVGAFVAYGAVLILDKLWYHVIYSYPGGAGWALGLLVLAFLGTVAVDVLLWIDMGNRTGESDLGIFVASGVLVIVYGLWVLYLLVWNYFFWVASSQYQSAGAPTSRANVGQGSYPIAWSYHQDTGRHGGVGWG